MKYSLLDMVQSILNDMDSDSVNSIADTTESEQVALIVRDTYNALISTRNWPHLKRLTSLTPHGSSARPTHVSVPPSVKELVSINYNKTIAGSDRLRYAELTWREPDDFLRLLNGRDSTSTTVQTVTDPTGVVLLISKNKHPDYYTSFNDKDLVFDSFNISVDDSIQASKIQALAYITPTWVHEDDFIPDLPEEAFMALVEEAKSRCSMKLKQMPDQKSEQEARRQHTWLSRKAWTVSGGVKRPNYGRKR